MAQSTQGSANMKLLTMDNKSEIYKHINTCEQFTIWPTKLNFHKMLFQLNNCWCPWYGMASPLPKVPWYNQESCDYFKRDNRVAVLPGTSLVTILNRSIKQTELRAIALTKLFPIYRSRLYQRWISRYPTDKFYAAQTFPCTKLG